MKRTMRFTSLLIATALLATPLALVAQTDDQGQSDTGIALDVAGDAVGLPTSTDSAVTMGLEKATGLPFSIGTAAGDLAGAAGRAGGLSDAAATVLSDAVGAFAGVTFNSSSTISQEEDSPQLWAQQAAEAQAEAQAAQTLKQIELDHQAEFDQVQHNWLYNPSMPPTGPQITTCWANCNK